MSSGIRTYPIKIVLLGSDEKSKKYVLDRLAHQKSLSYVYNSIGVEFAVSNIVYNSDILGKINVSLSIWMLSSHPKWKRVRRIYYKKALIAIIVFSSNNPQSFFDVSYWVNEYWSYVGRKLPIIVIEVSKNQSNELEEKAMVLVSRIREENHGLAEFIKILSDDQQIYDILYKAVDMIFRYIAVRSGMNGRNTLQLSKNIDKK